MTAPASAIGKREPVVAALILAAMTIGLLRPSIRGVDGGGNYVYLMSMLNDGDLDFANDYAALDHARGTSYRLSDAPVHPMTGRPANRYGIGAALFWAPAVILVHSVLRLLAPDLATGFSPPYEWAVGVASAWWGCLGVWLLFMRLREEFGSAAAWLSAGGVLLATPLGFYVWAHGSMSHAVSFFASVMALLSLERAWVTQSSWGALAAGFWAALLTLIRIQDATWALVLGAALIVYWRPGSTSSGTEEESTDRGGMNRWVAGALFALAAAVVMLPQLTVWNYLYGSWMSGPLPYLGREGGRLEVLPRHLLGVLASEHGGVFAWHPILLLGLAGLAARRGLAGGLRATALAGIILQILLISCWSMWWGGASFGNRFFISSYPFFALGLAHALRKIRERSPSWAALALVLGLILWNCGLLVQYGVEMIPREEEVGWARVLKNQFTEVPRWASDRLGALLSRL